MPRGSRETVWGIIDSHAFRALKELKTAASFTTILHKSKIPKSSLHQTLMKLADSRMIKRIASSYQRTMAGELFIRILDLVAASKELSIRIADVVKVKQDVERANRMERAGYSRTEQLHDLLELFDNVPFRRHASYHR